MKTLIVSDEKTQEEVTLQCTHAEEWPPVKAIQPVSAEELLQRGWIDTHTYQQIETWRRNCNKTEMDIKCQNCPLCLNAATQKPLHKKPQTFIPFARAVRKGPINKG